MEDEWIDYYSEISNLEDYDEDFNEKIHDDGFINRKFKYLSNHLNQKGKDSLLK